VSVSAGEVSTADSRKTNQVEEEVGVEEEMEKEFGKKVLARWRNSVRGTNASRQRKTSKRKKKKKKRRRRDCRGEGKGQSRDISTNLPKKMSS